MTAEEQRQAIDRYADSVHATIGFLNFYRSDDRTRADRPGVVVFQGRRLTPSPASNSRAPYVTPDLGVLLPDGTGVIAEVKKRFPRDERHWFDDFAQLKRYDDDLDGWPTPSGHVSRHDIVLLLHQSRAVRVKRFFEENVGRIGVFDRRFCMVEFNRCDERQSYVFFRTVTGSLTAAELAKRLENGVPVPMAALTRAYSEIKLYDAEPPLAYLLEIIWLHFVAARATRDPRFPRLHRNQRIEVDFTIAELAEELHTKFSFRRLEPPDPTRQPRVPGESVVQRACNVLVGAGDAGWLDPAKTTVRFRFRRLERALLDYFIDLVAKVGGVEGQAPQPELPGLGDHSGGDTDAPPPDGQPADV